MKGGRVLRCPNSDVGLIRSRLGARQLLDHAQPQLPMGATRRFGRWLTGRRQALERFQFESQGFFCVGKKGNADSWLVFNRTVTLDQDKRKC